MLKVFHIVQDDAKFFVPVSNTFDIDGRYKNLYFCILAGDKPELSSIPNDGRVTPLHSGEEIKKALNSTDYDILFFHSLPVNYYRYFRFIPNDKIVIWWGWGYDLYLRNRGMRPLIPVNLYKSETAEYIRKRDWTLKYFLKWLLKTIAIKHYYYSLRNKVLDRIDFFVPVISLEYELMKRYNKHFKAKEFYYHSYRGFPLIKMQERKQYGNIIFGNSAACTCNHLDVLMQLKNIKLKEGQKFIAPLNYVDLNYGADVAKASGRDDFIALTSFLPRDEWFSIVNGSSYYILGVMRQQAIGNVSYCLQNGLKLFLYKDSLVYAWLEKLRCTVFAIEDIDASSFSKPLSLEEAEHNYEIYASEYRRQAAVSHKVTDEIEKKLCANCQ